MFQSCHVSLKLQHFFSCDPTAYLHCGVLRRSWEAAAAPRCIRHTGRPWQLWEPGEEIDIMGLQQMVAEGKVAGGMILKVECCMRPCTERAHCKHHRWMCYVLAAAPEPHRQGHWHHDHWLRSLMPSRYFLVPPCSYCRVVYGNVGLPRNWLCNNVGMVWG